jgi:hypothetical protein
MPGDPLSGVFLDSGAEPRDVCWALGYDELCAGGGFQELYRVRELWAAFLELRNTSRDRLTLRELISLAEPDNERYRPFTVIQGETLLTQLPQSPVLPDQSVLIPLATLLAPIDRLPPPPLSTVSDDLAGPEYQELDHVDYSTLTPTMGVLGAALWPASVVATHGERELTQAVHDLDLSNLYTLDRHWAAGSCPHLFFRNADGRLAYLREIFSKGPRLLQKHSLEIPEGVFGVVLAELEHEETSLAWIEVNGQAAVSERLLRFGESVAVCVKPGDTVVLVGAYTPRTTTRQDPLFQNRCVWEFLARDCTR